MAVGYILAGILLAGVCLAVFAVFRPKRTPAPGRQDLAALKLSGYGERLRACAEEIEQPHADVFWDMAQHVERIRAEILADHGDLTQARRFIHHHARLIVELVEKFVTLNTKARPEHAERLAGMAAQIHGYRDVFARVEKALIDNDFDDIEMTMAALDIQLDRLEF